MIDRTEVWRYLGLRGAEPDEQTARNIEQCISALQAHAVPKHRWKRVPLIIEENTVRLGAWVAQSKALAAHMQGCKEGVLFAATLGAQADRLMQRYTVEDIALALVLQACAAAMLENYCDTAQESIAEECGCCRMTMRFSPGYGDLAAESQKQLLDILDAPRKIGLTCTELCMLTPTKSITAMFGIGGAPAHGNQKSCRACAQKDCAYQRLEQRGTV